MKRNTLFSIPHYYALAFLLVSFLLQTAGPSLAQELSARQIVENSDDLMRGESLEGSYTMTVVTPHWQRKLELHVTSKGREKIFIRILSPAKEKGITTLRIGTEMWNYLPKVERTIKIPPSMMLQPWMGSDFANDDLVKESSIVNDYTHEIVGAEDVDGKTVVIIELTPKPQAAVIWSKRKMWINKKDFIPLRDEFYGRRGKLIKVLTYSEVQKISDRFIPTRWEMVSHTKEGQRTIIEVGQDVVYNKVAHENIFSLRNLKSN